ncbi:hypothetical protein B0F90DRAFT_1816993 [Multifurca ochricompacta]|uniref:Uncharacterized protein n=1 Tax=Multifurca ochricompacta TaxID=376703 RepID=A0AAD4QMG4_9AGAM|nr:hypothetical protein B0F90DRAFT_1816993 [Multifurca ochricompacta]
MTLNKRYMSASGVRRDVAAQEAFQRERQVSIYRTSIALPPNVSSPPKKGGDLKLRIDSTRLLRYLTAISCLDSHPPPLLPHPVFASLDLSFSHPLHLNVMTNWEDPEHLAQSYIDFIKLEHVLAGIYLWEFFINLHYEWSFITRKRKWLWTVGVYITCRFSALLSTIVNIFVMDTNKKINCQIWIIFCEILALIALASGSFLIVVRISAIWERKKHIMILAASVWSVNVGFWIHFPLDMEPNRQYMSQSFHLQGTATIHCYVCYGYDSLNYHASRLWRKGEFQRSGLWNLLWTQGLTWVALAAVADIPMIVRSLIPSEVASEVKVSGYASPQLERSLERGMSVLYGAIPNCN